MTAFNNYQQYDDKAFPGMKADSALDTVDSYAVETATNPGIVVKRGTDGSKQCKPLAAAADAAAALGITVHTHKELETPYYPVGYSVPVMTFGDIYIEAGGDITPGTVMAIDASLKFVAHGASGATDISIDGKKVVALEGGANGDVIKVRIG